MINYITDNELSKYNNINIKNGNIFDNENTFIAHQVNCLGIMGSGIAKELKIRYPEVYDQYLQYIKNNYNNLLGTNNYARTYDGIIIVNMFGQYNIGYNKQQTNYSALEKCFINLKDSAILNKVNNISIPYKIGSCRGGGNWKEVLSIIVKVFGSTNNNIDLWKL